MGTAAVVFAVLLAVLTIAQVARLCAAGPRRLLGDLGERRTAGRLH